eukprot:TRINITY_DN44728_c0_g2_i1.p1 TRINITY_DN44728_c0_g2~~TRINITY_DN44728_c0_g2_i1.p1  ORF type:complete len:379 (-),score=63.26 TRINITY_DN44728_c0_g2_i1:560-1696(-)
MAYAQVNAKAFSEEEVAEVMQPQRAGCLGRFARAAATMTVGTALGCAAYSATAQGRFRAPVNPLKTADMQKIEALPATLPLFPAPYPVQGNFCGEALRCANGDQCCPGGPGYGFSCGATGAVCCQGIRFCEDGSPGQFGVSIVCAKNDNCCRNSGGNPYCCSQATICEAEICVLPGATCFPGTATVEVRGEQQRQLAHVAAGDLVLTEDIFGQRSYEPVIGWLHRNMDDDAVRYLSVLHEHGELQLTERHLLFVEQEAGARVALEASGVKAGDRVLTTSDDLRPSSVLSVRRIESKSGAFAPLTPSGTVVVDNVVASSYAEVHSTPAGQGAMHAAFFVYRTLARISLPVADMSVRSAASSLADGRLVGALCSSSQASL